MGSSKRKEFILACMVDEAKVGQRFTIWPLHVTLLPWFEASDLSVVEAKLKAALEGFGAVYTKISGRDTLGPRKQPVMLVEKTDKLSELHKIVLNVINQNDWPLKGRWTGDLYKPHITQKMGRDAEEGELVIDKIFVVESQAQGYREIVAEISL